MDDSELLDAWSTYIDQMVGFVPEASLEAPEKAVARAALREGIEADDAGAILRGSLWAAYAIMRHTWKEETRDGSEPTPENMTRRLSVVLAGVCKAADKSSLAPNVIRPPKDAWRSRSRKSRK